MTRGIRRTRRPEHFDFADAVPTERAATATAGKSPEFKP